MTRDEFEENRRRFGDDIETWPAPYRQEALAMTGDGNSSPAHGEDIDLDRLVLRAISTEANERIMTRRIMERINAPMSVFHLSQAMNFLLQPTRLAAGAAILLLAAMAGGYHMAQGQNDWLDSRLLAFATGAPLLNGEISGLTGDPAMEEGSL